MGLNGAFRALFPTREDTRKQRQARARQELALVLLWDPARRRLAPRGQKKKRRSRQGQGLPQGTRPRQPLGSREDWFGRASPSHESLLSICIDAGAAQQRARKANENFAVRLHDRWQRNVRGNIMEENTRSSPQWPRKRYWIARSGRAAQSLPAGLPRPCPSSVHKNFLQRHTLAPPLFDKRNAC